MLDLLAKQKNIDKLRGLDPFFGFDLTKVDLKSEMNKFNSISKYERSKLVDQKLEKEARKYFITTKTIF
jgi:hypothetical protein